MFIKSVHIMKLLHAVNADGNGHHFMIFLKKVLRFRTEPQLTVCGKRNSGKRRKRDTAFPALLKPVIADAFNQGGFQQRLSPDKVKNNGFCVLVDEVRGVLLIQIQQIINDSFAGFGSHTLRSFVMLVAIRTPEIAPAGHLKCNIATSTSRFR